MGRAGSPTISQARSAGSWHIADSRRTRPSRRIGEAYGANVGTAVEEVAPSVLQRSAAGLQTKTPANLPRKLERGVGMAAIEERSVKLRKDAHSK